MNKTYTKIINNIFLVPLFLFLVCNSLIASSDNDYLVLKEQKYEIIYTKIYEKEAYYVKSNIDALLKANDKSFGYSFDEPLRIVLVSDEMQVANAFSTQVPYNLTTFYNGGSSMVDYFGTTSWLNTILNHELSHNYQLNAKKSPVSKTLHQYLGNNYLPIMVGFLPVFTLPNIYLPTAILEGNAVLNESIYNNGGRLYSGRFKALKNSLMQNNKINFKSIINDNLEFPYMESKYIIGGFYMEFLARKYGADKVNSFFYTHSDHFINPFLFNQSFLETFRQTFSSSINEFIAKDKKENSSFKTLQDGKIIGRSNRQIYINKDGNNIYFQTSDLKNRAKLYTLDLNKMEIKSERTKLKNGLIFQLDGELYSSSDGYISKELYKNGLFNDDANIHPDTIGKNIQDVNKDDILYFDVQKSYDKPALYKNKDFLDYVDSSAIFDKNNSVYYMKQNGLSRSILKNKEKVYEYDGYYGKVVDVIGEEIYFVANSEFGSTLYKYTPKGLVQITNADNIIDAKAINDKTFLVVTVDHDGYYVKAIQNPINSIMYSVFPTKPIQNAQNFSFVTPAKTEPLNGKTYNEVANLEYSAIYPSYGYDSKKGSLYSLNGFFTDPLMFNSVSLNVRKDYDEEIVGATYVNNRYYDFQLSLYDINKQEKLEKDRGYYLGTSLSTEYYKNDLTALGVGISYYLDSDYKEKDPLTLSASYNYKEQYSLGHKPYFNVNINAFTQKDRDNNTLGVLSNVNHHLVGDTYIGANFKRLDSDVVDSSQYKGIRLITKTLNTKKDIANTLIEGLKNDVFVKTLSSAGIDISSTFYVNRYFEYFPIGLQKETFFGSYNYYDIATSKGQSIKEFSVGVELDLLLFYKFKIPLVIKRIENKFDDEVNKKTLVYINTVF